VVKENYESQSGERKTDAELRIVYWKAEDFGSEENFFVIYGRRPYSTVSGHYSPYRLKCINVDQVCHFAKTVISCDNTVSLELRHFDALNDDSEDELNIDWDNNVENGSTELVAFDFEPVKTVSGETVIPFANSLANLLRRMMEVEVV
jgi:hypothetical protein